MNEERIDDASGIINLSSIQIVVSFELLRFLLRTSFNLRTKNQEFIIFKNIVESMDLSLEEQQKRKIEENPTGGRDEEEDRKEQFDYNYDTKFRINTYYSNKIRDKYAIRVNKRELDGKSINDPCRNYYSIRN